MLRVINECHDPYYNLALEEYLVTSMPADQEYFMLWQNRPAIIIGRHQNTTDEINEEFVQRHDIAVVRRNTGGGAVYHDLGNLNYSFVIVDDEGSLLRFERFTSVIIAALASFGVKAEQSGRNDITIEGKKFSGSSQYRFQHRLLSNGTLLYDVDMETLAQALTVDPAKLKGKGVTSVRSRVTNLKEHLPPGVTLEQFAAAVVKETEERYDLKGEYHLSAKEEEAVRRLMRDKFMSPAWNYGASPRYNLRKKHTFPWGTVDVRMEVRDGTVLEARIFGDFFAAGELAELENSLRGVRLSREELEKALLELPVSAFLPQTTPGELADFLSE